MTPERGCFSWARTLDTFTLLCVPSCGLVLPASGPGSGPSVRFPVFAEINSQAPFLPSPMGLCPDVWPKEDGWQPRVLLPGLVSTSFVALDPCLPSAGSVAVAGVVSGAAC